jgi:NADH:ubiquinone oxidoreductase subunit E
VRVDAGLARRTARWGAWGAALCVALLIGDHAIAAWRSAGQASLVRELGEQSKSDEEAALRLHQERERQTAASLARETRGRIAAWLLLVSASLFVASSTWLSWQREPRSPTLEEAAALRLALMAPGNGAGLSVRPPAPPPEDLAFVDELIDRHGPGREAAIPILQAIQGHYRYLPDDALQRVCERTEITPAQIAGTSSFYAQFRRSPVGLYVVRICHGTACHVAGAEQITQELRRHLAIPPAADTDPERRFTLDAVACVGCCSLAPVMMIEDDTAGRLTPASARQALDTLAARA